MKKSHDIWLILSLAGLSAFGMFNIYGIRSDLLFNYALFLIAGWTVFILTSRVNMTLLEQNYKVLYIIFIALFVLTFIIGEDIRGSKRWIDLYIFNFQTSEFFKPVFLITMAAVLSSVNKFTPRKLFVSVSLFLFPCIMIFLQPDLGTALLYMAAFLSIMYFSGLSTRLVLRAGLVIAAIMPFGWLLLRDYQKARIIGFMNPEIDPQGLTYNLNQSIISIGSGGLFGKGLGLGTQTRFRFLPEFQTDFAYASLVEQFGFIGGLIVLILFSVVLIRLVRKLFVRRDNEFEKLYLLGVIVFLLTEITVNIGMNMGLLPVTGIALPFISYGGSAIVSTMLLLGLALAL